MTDNPKPPVGPNAEQHTIEIPVPTQNPKFWMERVRRAFRETLTFSGIAVVLILVGVGLDIGGIGFNHTGWSAEVGGFALGNAGPGDLLIVAALAIFVNSRFHVKMRRIFTGRAQLRVKAVVPGAVPADQNDGPPDDTELLNLVVMCQDTISSVFGWTALAMLGAGVLLTLFGFDLGSLSLSAPGFGLKLTNAGPGVTLTIVGTLVYSLTRFDIGVEGIGDARTAMVKLVTRSKADPAKKDDTK